MRTASMIRMMRCGGLASFLTVAMSAALIVYTFTCHTVIIVVIIVIIIYTVFQKKHPLILLAIS